MHIKDLQPALVSGVGAVAASLCCFLPLGILAVTVGYVLYFRERRRCQRLVCTMAGSRVNLIALGLATVVLLGEMVLVAFPEAASRLLTRAMVSAANQVEHVDAEGTIVSVDPGKHLMTIDHGDIKGVMSPMTMAFPVQSPALFTEIAPGDRVRFTLERSPQGLAIIALTKPETARAARVVLDIEGMT